MPEVTDPSVLGRFGKQRGATVISADPYKPNAERRAEEDQAFQRAAAARDAQRLQQSAQGQALTAQGQQNTQANTRFDNLNGMRNSFNQLQPVKEYKAVLPILMQGLQTAPDPQGDSALIYAYAKIMDPGSVVRESESEMALNTAPWLQAKVEQFKKNFGYSDAGGVPKQTRDRLRVEMNRKVAQLAQLYGSERLNAQEFAKANGYDADQIVGRSPAEPFTKRYLELVPGAREHDAAPDFSKAGTAVKGAPTLDPNARFSTETDKKNSAVFNAAFKSGASLDELQALSQTISGAPLSDAQVKYINSNPDRAKALEFGVSQTGMPGAVQDAVTSAVKRDDIWGDLSAGALNYGNSALLGFPQLAAGDDPSDAMRAQHFKSSLTGDIAGGLTTTLLGAAGLVKAGVGPVAAGLFANNGYGGIYGSNTSEGNRLKGAGTGVASALLGEGAGRYAVAPVIKALGDTSVVQAILNKIPGAGAIPADVAQPTRRLLNDITPQQQDIMARLDEAAGHGLPYSIADADPVARQALGSASRLSPTVRSDVGRQLQDRSLAQADRAITGIENNLTKPVSMSGESDAIRAAAQDAASPFYGRAYQQPAITTPGLEGLLQRPSMRNAMSRAEGIISEEGGNSQSLGFALDASGAPVLNPIPANELAGLGKAHTDLLNAQDALARANASLSPGNLSQLQRNVDDATLALEEAKTSMAGAPSVGSLSTEPAYNWKALDYSKRGLDDVVEALRDPITRRLNLDEGGRAIERTRTQYRNTLGSLNDDYRQGLDAYSDVIRGRDALNNGYTMEAPNVTKDEFMRGVEAVAPENMGRLRQGHATAMSDRINRSRLSGNPYDLVAGTPDQQTKLAALYPESDQFLRRRELERDMAQTTQEVNGGSPTAARMAADQRFSNGANLGDAAEITASLATGMPPVGVATRMAVNPTKGYFARRSEERAMGHAEEIAPLLANTDPVASSQALQDIIAALSERVGYEDYLRRTLGAGTGAASTTAYSGSR